MLLREAGVGPGDRVVVAVGATPDWAEAVLACLKVGAAAVPLPEHLTTEAFDIRIAASRAKLVVVSSRAEAELAQCVNAPAVLTVETARREASRLPTEAPTHDTAARDPALLVHTAGRMNGPRGVLHTHAATFAARAHAEHWLDAGVGDVVWCTARVDSASALWSTLFGPWARSASIVLHDSEFDPAERLDLLERLGVTILCQTPEEYRALAESGLLARYRRARPRRLVASGDALPDDVVEAFEDEWGLTIHDGYAPAEAGIVVGHSGEGAPAGSIGRALPGYEVAVVDERGEELPPGRQGSLAVRVGNPSLFAGYWNAPDATNASYRRDWFLTGDDAVADADGFLWLAARAANAPVPAVDPSAVIDHAPPVPPIRNETAPSAGPQERRVPLFARLALTLWLLFLGVMDRRRRDPTRRGHAARRSEERGRGERDLSRSEGG